MPGHKKYNIISSISRSFWAIASFVVLTIMLLSLIFSLIIYYSYVEKKKEVLPTEASKIEYVFTDSIQYIENYSKFIGKRISENNANDFEYIASLLGGDANTSPNPQNLFISTLFDWVTPDKKMWVSSDTGVFKEPIDMSQREYLERTDKFPWTLQLQGPSIGIPSGQWIIPGGMGITDKKGKYLGALTFGFSIDGLAKKISVALGANDIRFVILNSNLIYIGSSSGGSQKDNKLFFQKILQNNTDIKEKNSAFLDKEIVFEGSVYSYFTKTGKYGFTILTGHSARLPHKIFNEILLPRLMEFSSIGFIVLLIIIITHKSIIKPIIEISNTADKLAKGESNVKIPHGGPYEIYVLSKQLINLQRYIKRIQRIDKKLYKAKQEAERANKAKSDFLANMSHELRTPLNAIIGYSEIIETEMFGTVGNGKYKEYAGDIHSSGIHLLSLINDILDISKAEAGKFEINDQVVDICISTRESIKLISEQAAKKKILLKTHIPTTPILMQADPLRIKQIVINILSNAIKFSDGGQPITIKVKESNGVLISIKDNGIGIAKNDIPKILEKFGHIKNSIRRQSEGTGIGLWLTKMLIEAHNGVLEIESEVGVGTEVTVFFPDHMLIKE